MGVGDVAVFDNHADEIFSYRYDGDFVIVDVDFVREIEGGFVDEADCAMVVPVFGFNLFAVFVVGGDASKVDFSFNSFGDVLLVVFRPVDSDAFRVGVV